MFDVWTLTLYDLWELILCIIQGFIVLGVILLTVIFIGFLISLPFIIYNKQQNENTIYNSKQ